MRIIHDHEAIRIISHYPNRYVCYLGAGASNEVSEVPLAGEICDGLSEEFSPPECGSKEEHETDPTERNPEKWDDEKHEKFVSWRKTKLFWNEPGQKYAACLQLLPNRMHRNERFEDMLEGKDPSFVHHATALLMREGIFKSTCITTNFDKLLEQAFVIQNKKECQAIRLDEEAKYWREARNKCYVLKLHGDCDTCNVANTHEETRRISPQLSTHVATLLRSSGLVVLGTAGNERSIQNLFDDLDLQIGGPDGVLDYGILWGVFVGKEKPDSVYDAKCEELVRDAIGNNVVNSHIVQMIDIAGRKEKLFTFFPIWGATQFMHDLIEYVSDRDKNRGDPARESRDLRDEARRYYDLRKRLEDVFSELEKEGLEKHLGNLDKQRKGIENFLKTQPALPCERILEATLPGSGRELHVLRGDIASHAVLRPDTMDKDLRAVVSPDDTRVSAGGGVAFLLAKKAGLFAVLNELQKIGHVKLGEVAVTSAGELPVEYIFHAAAGEVMKDGRYRANKKTVGDAIENVLRKARALGVKRVWTPLLAAGTGGLEPQQSLSEICRRISSSKNADGVKVSIVVFPKDLDRSQISTIVNQRLLPGWNL